MSVNFAKTTFTTGLLARYWLFALGALFVVTTIWLPKGILGKFNDLWERWRSSPSEKSETKPAPVPQLAE